MSGLDPIGRRSVRELILRLRERGTTVMFSTHILSDATLLCDRVGIVVGGELRDTGPLGKLLAPGIENVEVLWTAPDELAERLQSRPGTHTSGSEGRLSLVADLAAANELCRAVIDGGGEVLHLVPQRQGLEDLFVAEAKRPQR
jgi:ABC-2 type transport system ATP-binding protein